MAQATLTGNRLQLQQRITGRDVRRAQAAPEEAGQLQRAEPENAARTSPQTIFFGDHLFVPVSTEQLTREAHGIRPTGDDFDGEPATPSASNGNGGNNCVQVARLENNIIVGDSKDPTGPILVYTMAEWEAFLDGVRKEEFEIEKLPLLKWRGKGNAPNKEAQEREEHAS